MGNIELPCEIIWMDNAFLMDTGKIDKDATMIKIGQAIYYCNSLSRSYDFES